MTAPQAHMVASMCEGKLKMTGAEAKKAKRSHERRHKGQIGIYRCGVCGGWHLGGQLIVRRKRVAK